MRRIFLACVLLASSVLSLPFLLVSGPLLAILRTRDERREKLDDLEPEIDSDDPGIDVDDDAPNGDIRDTW